MSKEFIYTGQDNLKSMQLAINYNVFLLSLVTKHIKSKKAKILDFGSGIGTHCTALKKQGYTNVDCLEIDKHQARELETKGFRVYQSINQLVDADYDLIYSFDVFEHIADDKAIYAQLFSKLKKGGKIITYVPAFQVLFSEMDHLVEHKRRYDDNLMKSMLRGLDGRKTLEQYYADPLGFIISFIYNKFMPRNKNGHITSGQVKIYDRYIFPVSKAISILTRNIFGKSIYNISTKI